MLVRSITELRLLTLDGRNHLARVPTGTELEVPDTLPGPCRQTTIGNGNIHRSTDERRLDMSLARDQVLASRKKSFQCSPFTKNQLEDSNSNKLEFKPTGISSSPSAE